MNRLLREGRFVWQLLWAFSADGCTFLAAALSFFVFFSFFPLFLLLVAIVGHFIDMAAAMHQVRQVLHEAVPQQEALLLDLIRSVVNHRGQASLIAVATLSWSARNLFLSLGQALNMLWKVPADRGVFKENVLAIALALGVGLVAVAGSLVFAVLNAITSYGIPLIGLPGERLPFMWQLFNELVPVTMAATGLSVLYRVLPNRRLGWREVLPGAIVAAFLWEVLRRCLGFLFEHLMSFDAVYGSISGIVSFLFWIYMSSCVFLLGAEIGVVRARQREAEARTTEEAPPEPI